MRITFWYHNRLTLILCVSFNRSFQILTRARPTFSSLTTLLSLLLRAVWLRKRVVLQLQDQWVIAEIFCCFDLVVLTDSVMCSTLRNLFHIEKPDDGFLWDWLLFQILSRVRNYCLIQQNCLFRFVQRFHWLLKKSGVEVHAIFAIS